MPGSTPPSATPGTATSATRSTSTAISTATRHRARWRRSTAPDPVERIRNSGVVGFFRAAQLENAGLTRDQLPALLRSGRVERVGRGLYRLADAEPTENYSIAMACARAPNSIVCLLSALRIHGIGTQTPAEVWLAIPHKARKPLLRELKLRTVRFSGPA